MRYRWVLFDADGTLFDYEKAEERALRRTFEELGCAYVSNYAETYRTINGRIWTDFERGLISQSRLRTRRFELLFEAIQLHCDPEIFSTRYLLNLAQGTDLIAGADRVLESLYGRVGMVMITNGLAAVQRSRLARSEISGYFVDIVISEEVGAAKPDERIFDVAFERMNNPARKDVLIVGDSLASDIWGGNRYGIDTCWYNPSRKSPDLDVTIQYQIEHLSELLALLGVQETAGRGDGGS